MQTRRSFFGAALAFVSASLIPKSAQATPPPDNERDAFNSTMKKVVDDYEETIRELEETVKNGPSAFVFDDYFAMTEAIIEHVAKTGDDVLVADDPAALPPRLGYVTASKDPARKDIYFSINIARLKESLDKPEHNKPVKSPNVDDLAEPFKTLAGQGPSKADLVRLCLKTVEGKTRLAMAMQGAGRARAKERAGS